MNRILRSMHIVHSIPEEEETTSGEESGDEHVTVLPAVTIRPPGSPYYPAEELLPIQQTGVFLFKVLVLLYREILVLPSYSFTSRRCDMEGSRRFDNYRKEKVI